MTELKRCRWCRRVLPEQKGPGRRRVFCSQPCRQWDWVARQRARDLELSEGELVMTRSALDELHDELYVLACAVDDAEADLADIGPNPDPAELLRTLTWLLEAARPLKSRELTPATPPAPAPEPPTITS